MTRVDDDPAAREVFTAPADRPTGERPPLLLSYRTLGLGDLLAAVPALRALRRAFPEHQHVLASSGWLRPLVACIGGIDRHVPVDELGSLPAGLRPDVAVDLHGNGAASHDVVAATQPNRLIAFHDPASHGGRGGAPRWAPPDVPTEEHERARWCRLLREHGIPADEADLGIDAPPGPTPDVARGAVVVHPGAKHAARRWPPERFAAVAAALDRDGHRVVVTGDAGEVPLAQRIASRAGLPPGAVLAGRLDVAGLARVVAAASRVVCGDTGVAHVATALGTPSVVLFGPVSPAVWGPPGTSCDRHRVLWAGTYGDPHGTDVDPGLLGIQIDDVLDELASLDGGGHWQPTLGGAMGHVRSRQLTSYP